MPSSDKNKLKDLHLASSLGELNKLADPGLPVDRNANPSPYIKSSDKVYLNAQDHDLEGDEEYAYVYYMRFFNIISLIKKTKKYSDNKKYFDNLMGKTKMIKSIDRAEVLQKSLVKRYEKLSTQKEADKKAQEEAKRKDEEDKKNLESMKAKHGNGTDSDSGFDSDIDSLLNGNSISSSSDVYQKLKINHNSILTPKSQDNGSGTLITGLESPSLLAKSGATDGSLRCVTAQDLYNLLTPESETKILILDCRPHAMFSENRIRCSCCINIPAELLDQGVSVGNIERRLPEATRKIWNKRGEKEFVILMDESTKIADITPESRIQRLKDVIFTFDSYSSLKNEPLFLDGGFHSWLWHYPSVALKAELPKVQSQPKPVTPIDLSSLDYPELPGEKISSPQLPSPDIGHINSNHQHPALPTAGLQNVDGQLLNPKGIIEQDKSLPSPSPAPFQPTPNVPSPGPLPDGKAPSAGLSPVHTAGPNFNQPGIPPAVSSSQPGMQSSMGIAPQAFIPHPNPAGPRTPGSLPNATAPHPSGQTGLQTNTPNPTHQMAPNTQPSSLPSATVPKPVLQPGVPFSSPSIKQSAQPGISPPQPTISQSTSSSNMSTPGALPAGVNSTSSTTQVHSVATLKVTPAVSTLSSAGGQQQGPQLPSKLPVHPQGPGVAAPPVSGHVPGQQSVQPGNQPQVPSVSQVSHGGTQVPGKSSLPAAQHHQAATPPIPRADPGNNSNGSKTTINSSEIFPPGRVDNSNQMPTQVGPSGSTRQPDGQQKVSKPSQQAVFNKATISVTTPGLPPGWERVESGEKVYYKDHNTHTTHWQPPSSGTTPAAPQSSVQKQQQSQSGTKGVAPQSRSVTGLPPGWEKVESGGKVYYKDNNTHTTHWKPPSSGTMPAAPQSSVQKQQQAPIKRQSSVERPMLRRSNSSPNLKKQSDQASFGPKTPVIDRLSKPDSGQTAPARPVINRVAKPLSANQLDSFNPSYGGLGAGLTGLRNLGNTCYMNSVVQCLSSVSPLAAFFISGVYREDLNRSNRDGTKGELAESFSVLVRVLHSGQFKCVSPGDFKRTVGKFKSQFSGYDQQDSQELLAFLMDGLQEDLNKVKSKPYLKAPADDLDPQTAAKIAWENHKKRNESVMVELFDGLFMSTVRCLACNKESRTFDTFSNLTLPLPANTSRCSLQDCLTLFTKPEKMSGDDKWFCPKCQQRREASKKIQIWRLPAILVIHLKRFQYEGMWRQKLQTGVSFEMTQLDMSNFVVGPKFTTRYNLHAVSNHYGTMHGGHYTAFCKSVYDKKWYKFDDQYVSEMSPREVVTSAGYLLFYTSFDFKPPKYLLKA